MLDLPSPVSRVDQESFEAILSVPWLKDSISPTGRKWGRGMVDVEISRFPNHLLGQVMLVRSDDSSNSPFSSDEVLLVVYRWDQYDHLGWTDTFASILTFPDGTQYEVEVPPSHRIMDGHSIRVPVGPTTVVRERRKQDNRTIPRIIYNLSAPVKKRDSHTVGRLLKNVRRITNLLQCTSLFLVLEDDACRQEVENSGIENFTEAYNALRTPSYKADLLRYYLLYKYGGVYLDDKTLIRQSLDSTEFDSIFSGEGSPGTVPCDMFMSKYFSPETAFMAARRGSPIMLKALQESIDNVIRREYTNHRLGITGNHLFAKVITSGVSEAVQGPIRPSPMAVDIGAKWVRYWGETCAILPIILSNDGVLIRNKFLWQRSAIPTSDWPESVGTFNSKLSWSQSRVYIDGNPPPSDLSVTITSKETRLVLQIGTALLVIAMIGFIISRYPPISWI